MSDGRGRERASRSGRRRAAAASADAIVTHRIAAAGTSECGRTGRGGIGWRRRRSRASPIRHRSDPATVVRVPSAPGPRASLERASSAVDEPAHRASACARARPISAAQPDRCEPRFGELAGRDRASVERGLVAAGAAPARRPGGRGHRRRPRRSPVATSRSARPRSAASSAGARSSAASNAARASAVRPIWARTPPRLTSGRARSGAMVGGLRVGVDGRIAMRRTPAATCPRRSASL